MKLFLKKINQFLFQLEEKNAIFLIMKITHFLKINLMKKVKLI